MKLTSLAKFFRFCGYGVALTAAILGSAAVVALVTMGFQVSILLGLIAVCILFIFAASWIVLSYGLQREGEEVDRAYFEALAEIERFRADSREWYTTHVN